MLFMCSLKEHVLKRQCGGAYDGWIGINPTTCNIHYFINFRSIAAHKRPDQQNLFAIIQGGLELELRGKCIEGGYIVSC